MFKQSNILLIRIFSLLLLVVLGVFSKSSTGSADSGVDVPVLMYHKVDTAALSEWWVSTELFARQMDALLAYGYTTVSLPDFLDYHNGTKTPPDKPIILTFDDGYQNFYDQVRPVLNQRGMTATNFVPTEKIGETERDRLDNSWDTPEALYPANHMIWDSEIDVLYKEGFQIESHSATHPRLSQVSQSEALWEMTQSRTDIQNHLGNDALFFCYPYGNGSYDTSLHNLLRQAGYVAAVAAYPDGIANTANSDWWSIPRLNINESHSVDLDPASPDDFFMRRIDPQFPLPNLSILAVQYHHQDGSIVSAVHPGETIYVTVKLRNDGDASDLRVNLNIDSNHDHSTFYYDEYLIDHLLNGETKEFTFKAAVPSQVESGEHLMQLNIFDEYGVLGFLYHNWEYAFSVKPLN